MFPTKTSGDDSEVITITGRKEKVEAAKKHLEGMIRDLENIIEDSITVNPRHYRHFIQRRGQVCWALSIPRVCPFALQKLLFVKKFYCFNV